MAVFLVSMADFAVTTALRAAGATSRVLATEAAIRQGYLVGNLLVRQTALLLLLLPRAVDLRSQFFQ